MGSRRRSYGSGVALFGAGVLAAVAALPELGTTSQEMPEPVPLVTGKRITPQGLQAEVGSFPANLLLSPDGRHVVVTNTGFRQYLSAIRVSDGKVASRIDVNARRRDDSGLKEGLYYGLAFSPKPHDGRYSLYVSRGAEDRVAVFTLDAEGRLADTGRSLANPSGVPRFRAPHHVAGLGLTSDGGRLIAANNHAGPESGMKGSVSILDTAGGRVLSRIPLPGFPFAVAAITTGANADRKAYVSSERDGVVSVIDPDQPRRVRDIATGDHPLALLLDRQQQRLFAANAGSDTVSVIDTRVDNVQRTILLRPDDARGLPGATPTGLALSRDERRLFVTLADMNAVAVVDVPRARLLGYVPVGWYPTSVVVSPDGKRLFVANAKGVNARNPNGKPAGPEGRWGRHPNGILEGTVSLIDVPGEAKLQRLTEQVIANNRLRPGLEKSTLAGFKNPGIEHVIYIVKENRTYDQVLGDLPRGNGDPTLCFFPREVSPNQHALAERFVLLDNFYCCAEVSADGWNWSTAGMANEYVTRNTPYSYGERGREYDYEGRNNGVAVDLQGIPDVSRPPGGYLWDQAAKHGVSLRNYGCFVDVELDSQGVPRESAAPAAANQATKKVLAPRTDVHFRQYDMTYADSEAWVTYNCPSPRQMKTYGKFGSTSRFAEWKREFDEYVRTGTLPKLTMIRLPRDHTSGTRPGEPSPRACVADNDYGVGQIVEAVSKSPYWKKTAIFIIEDDAQNGFDHVDAHRSVCFVVSPFIKQATVDHRFYNTDSVLRTIELLLGMPPMNQYDAVAPPLALFGTRAENDAPYAALLPEKRIIAEVNGATAYRAADSMRLNFEAVDAVPEQVLNDILWHAIRGLRTPKPPIRYGLSIEPDEEEDEEREAGAAAEKALVRRRPSGKKRDGRAYRRE